MPDNLEADFTVQRNNLNAEFDVVSNNLVAELVVQYTPNKTSQLMNDSGFVTQENIDTAITTEANARIATDESLQEQIDQWNDAFDGYRTAAAQDVIDNTIRGEIATEANVRLANDQVLQRNINTKQDIITDLNTIRAGASAGATAVQPAELNNYVPTTRKVNGKALATDITLSASDVGALSTDTLHNSLNGRASSGAHPISAITDLQNTLDGKQATLTTAQLAAVNSGVTAVDVETISTNTSNITTISSKIPSAATSSNQLADKAFVNSSINSVAAYYITSDVQGDAFATKAALDAGPWYFNGASRTPTTNDYALVEEDETHSDATTRYTYTGSQWAYQYTLNTTPFTQAQLDALNSGIDANLVSEYSTHVADTDIHVTTAEKTTWNGKQDAISDLSDIRSGAQEGATAVQPGDLATVATTGAYSDLTGKPTIPTVNDAALNIQQNGTTVQTFTANSSTNKIANIIVPTDTSNLTNGAGFITSSDVPVVDVTVGGSSVLSNRIAQIPSIPSTASDVGALPSTTNYGANLSYNSNNSSLTLLDQNGNTLGNSVTIVSGDSLPSQAGQSGKFLTTDGTDASWATIPSDSTKANTSLNNLDSTGQAVIDGKVDLNASNLSTQGKSLISGLGMPSNNYNDLTLLASGSTYTAPANGWFYFSKIASASNQYMTMYVDNGGNPIFATTMTQSIRGGQARCFLPVKKGDVVGVSYDLGGETRRFCFVYAKGEPNV